MHHTGTSFLRHFQRLCGASCWIVLKFCEIWSRGSRATDSNFIGARMCSRSSITMPILVGYGHRTPPEEPKMLGFCLLVCASHSWTTVCENDFTQKTLELRSGFDVLDRGRFVVMHSCSTLSLDGTTTGCQSWRGKIWGFSTFEGNIKAVCITLLGQLVRTMYSTAAVWNSSLLTIWLQVSSFV